jgi:VanZ family protein
MFRFQSSSPPLAPVDLNHTALHFLSWLTSMLDLLRSSGNVVSRVLQNRSARMYLIGGSLVVYLLGLCYGTHTPPGQLPIAIRNDTACHFAAYFGLGLIVWLVFDLRMRATLLMSIAVWVLVAALGVLDETTQPLVGRSFELKDIAADWIGAAMSITAMHFGSRLICSRSAVDATPPRRALVVPRRRMVEQDQPRKAA